MGVTVFFAGDIADRIVEVENAKVVQIAELVKLVKGMLTKGARGHVIASSVGVAGVKAVSDAPGAIGLFEDALTECCQFLEGATQV